jgi:hypothetical protein
MTFTAPLGSAAGSCPQNRSIVLPEASAPEDVYPCRFIRKARAIFPHLAGRQIKLDARKTFGIRRFSSDLPGDFGLRAVMGYLPESTAR